MFTVSNLIDLGCIALTVFIVTQLLGGVVVLITYYKANKEGF